MDKNDIENHPAVIALKEQIKRFQLEADNEEVKEIVPSIVKKLEHIL